MVSLGLNHLGHAAAAVSTAVQHPERAKMAAPLVLTLFGFSPLQVELLIGGFVLAVEAARLRIAHAAGRLPIQVRTRQN
jgi:hypothetical protein